MKARWLLLAIAIAAVGQETAKAPIVNEAEQLKIRKFELEDARLANAIQQRQLEIVQLERRRESIAKDLATAIGSVCHDAAGKYELDPTSDELLCRERKVK